MKRLKYSRLRALVETYYDLQKLRIATHWYPASHKTAETQQNGASPDSVETQGE